MFRQSLLLLLVVSFMLNAHAQLDPFVERCITNGYDSIGQFKKIEFDGKCRQPFEIGLITENDHANKIYTELTADSIDGSIIQYGFGTCKLKLKTINQDGDVWFKLLDAGSDSGKRIDPGFYIQLYESTTTSSLGMQVKQQDGTLYYQADCDVFHYKIAFLRNMKIKQIIEIGAPNIALILYKDPRYFGTSEPFGLTFFGEMPPYSSTTTTHSSSTTKLSSSTTKPSSSTAKSSSSTTTAASSTTTHSSSTAKSSSSSTQSISNTSLSSKVSTTLSETAAEEKRMALWFIGIIASVSVLFLIITIITTVICDVRHCKKKAQAVDKPIDETKTREPTLEAETVEN